MGKNLYLNIIATVGLIIIVILGIAIVKSIDESRQRYEAIFSRLHRVGSKINQLESILRREIRLQDIGRKVPRNSDVDQVIHKEAETIANGEFYDPKSIDGGRLIIPISTHSKNLNSLVNNDYFVSVLWGKTNDSLTARNFKKPELFEPLLADHWELSEDKMVYTVNLKKNVLWHDFSDPITGKKWENVEVTSKDFKFFIDVVKNKDVDCAPLRTYYKDLDRLEIVSKYKFKVHWKKKYFLSESFTLGLSPLPQHLYYDYEGPFDGQKFNDDFARNKIIIGCGPYRFDAWDVGKRIILKKWEKYYGNYFGIAPPIDKIVYEVIKHPNTQFQALLTGDIDKMSLQPDQWKNRTNIPEFDKDSPDYKLKKFKYTSRSYSYIGYNLNNPLFKDKRVRRGLTHLVDRKRILRDVFYDLGRITTGNFFIDSPYYDTKIKPYEFSVKKAKELLFEAGWTDSDGDGILDKAGKKFEFTILAVSNVSWHERMLPIMKEDFAEAGIVLHINTVEWSVYIQRLEKKDFDVVTLLWAMGFESDPYQIWHSSQADKMGSSNHISFKNEEADKLIEEIRICFDFNKRVELCHKLHRLLHDEQPYTFLFSRDTLMTLSKRYKNAKLFEQVPAVPEELMWVPAKLQKEVPSS